MYKDIEKYVFVGLDFWGNPPLPNVSWQYDNLGCRIGWNEKNCVIIAKDSDLLYEDYDYFVKYCKEKQEECMDNIVVPPDNFLDKGAEWFKNVLNDENNRSIHQAQYSVLVYEFMSRCFDSFIKGVGVNKDGNKEIEEILKDKKQEGLLTMSWSQAGWCHAIIHVASIACAAVAFFPVLMADAIPITSAQITMVVASSGVFNNKISESDAEALLKVAAAPLIGRVVSKNIFLWVPGVGWTINGAIAATVTEILGWSIASDFAVKEQRLKNL